MAASASACENGARRSCKFSRSRAMATPTTSGRVARDGGGGRRDDSNREQLVKPVEPGHVDGGECQAQNTAAGPQHAIGLLQRKIDLRHVADAKGDGVGVETAVGKRERLRIALD